MKKSHIKIVKGSNENKEIAEIEDLSKLQEKIDMNVLTTIGGRVYMFLDDIDLDKCKSFVEFRKILIADEYSLYHEEVGDEIVLVDTLIQVPLTSVDSIERHEVLKHKIVSE